MTYNRFDGLFHRKDSNHRSLYDFALANEWTLLYGMQDKSDRNYDNKEHEFI